MNDSIEQPRIIAHRIARGIAEYSGKPSNLWKRKVK